MTFTIEEQAIEKLEEAIRLMEKAGAQFGNHSTRELSVARTSAETALLWLQQDMRYKTGTECAPQCLSERQPDIAPESYERAELEVLTKEERVGMFGYDPLEGEQV